MRERERDVPIAFNDIDEVVCRCIGFSNGDVGVANLVLAENGLNFVLVDVGEGNGVGDSDTAFLFLADNNVWWRLVEPYSKTFEFLFNDFLVAERFEDIEDDKNEVACSGHWNDVRGGEYRLPIRHTSDD